MIFSQILSTYSLKKCIEIRLENLLVDIGAQRVKTLVHQAHNLILSFSQNKLVSVLVSWLAAARDVFAVHWSQIMLLV